jgi:pyruvate dehydrogenase E1 component alpha subunit
VSTAERPPEAPAPSSIDPAHYGRDFCLARVRDMLRIRRLEERSAQLYGDGKIRGFLRFHFGRLGFCNVGVGSK